VVKFFLDTNVLVYFAEISSPKALRAQSLLLQRPVVSVQVLNEFVRVLVRKAGKTAEEAAFALRPVRLAAEIVPVTLETHELAVSIACKKKIAIFDANIIAAAELAGCEILYTEDLNHGERIGRVLLQNPFLAQV
jgi:predicted nucleic acid-binding protein